MYQEFFGLREMPFAVTPDPRYAFKSLGHQLAEARMRFAADYRSGLAVLVGPVGCGKTTIANMLVADWSEDPKKSVAFLPSNEERGKSAFLRNIVDAFGVVMSKPLRNYGDIKRALEQFLLDEHEAGRHPVLVIDEAQRVYGDNLDTLVDLTNFQTASEKFLTIILIAQDSFANKLRQKDAFRSRIAFTGTLDPLNYEDMRGMIAHRLRVGGAKVKDLPTPKNEFPLPDLSRFLTDEALVETFKVTRGVPRDVCILLNALFLDAYVTNIKPVPGAMVTSTLAEMAKLKHWPVVMKGDD